MTAIDSVVQPGRPVVTFPNTVDRTSTTVLWSQPDGIVAGVGGRTLTVSTLDSAIRTDQLTIDAHGNVGTRGSYHTTSSRSLKKDIGPPGLDPLGVLDGTRIVRFRYATEASSEPFHLGIIADDAPAVLTGYTHSSFDLNNSVSIALAADQELLTRIRRLEKRIAMLEIEKSERRHACAKR